MEYIASLLVLAIVAFGQNMAFTAVSRSRNSADIAYHFRCALLSNSIWLVCYMFVMKQLWPVFESGAWWRFFPLLIVYTMATAAGSCFQMSRSLKKETGKRRVGAPRVQR
jgi:hypothetical protein